MLVRMLKNRLGRIEKTGENNNPNRIVIKNIGDLYDLYDKVSEDDSWLEKDIYYDLSFFKGDRKRHKEANESDELLIIGAGKENPDEENYNEQNYDEDKYRLPNPENTAQAETKPIETEPVKTKPEETESAEKKPSETEENNASEPESSVPIPESVFRANKFLNGGNGPCGSFD